MKGRLLLALENLFDNGVGDLGFKVISRSNMCFRRCLFRQQKCVICNILAIYFKISLANQMYRFLNGG